MYRYATVLNISSYLYIFKAQYDEVPQPPTNADEHDDQKINFDDDIATSVAKGDTEALKKWLDQAEKSLMAIVHLNDVAVQYGYTDIFKLLSVPILNQPVAYLFN